MRVRSNGIRERVKERNHFSNNFCFHIPKVYKFVMKSRMAMEIICGVL